MNKKALKLNQEQYVILTGLLLGDGHLESGNHGRSYRLKVEHSLQQLDYTEWLFEKFRNLCQQTKLYQRIRSDGRVCVGFTTTTLPSFQFHGQQFYAGKEKRIPPLLHKLVTPLSLAVWFMDDGSRKSLRHLTYNIHTLGYTKTDLELVKDTLLSTLGITVELHAQRNDTWRLYVGSSSARQFTEMINPIVSMFPSMERKLVNFMPKK